MLLTCGPTKYWDTDWLGQCTVGCTRVQTIVLAPTTATAYNCDSLYAREPGRFQRRYLQLECGLGTVIQHRICVVVLRANQGRFAPGCQGRRARDMPK